MGKVKERAKVKLKLEVKVRANGKEVKVMVGRVRQGRALKG